MSPARAGPTARIPSATNPQKQFFIATSPPKQKCRRNDQFTQPSQFPSSTFGKALINPLHSPTRAIRFVSNVAEIPSPHGLSTAVLTDLVISLEFPAKSGYFSAT